MANSQTASHPEGGNEVKEPTRIVLCLSGGGFRASLFHMGVLRYLAEAGQLSSVRAISTVSGGSIFGAFVASRWDQLARGGFSLAAYDAAVKRPFEDVVTRHNLRNRWLVTCLWRLPRLLRPGYSRGNVLADLFDHWLYGGKTMGDLPSSPELVLNATSLATGRQFRFGRQQLGEWEFGATHYGDHPVRLADAVAASSAFPFLVPPVRIDPRLYQWGKKMPAGDLWLADGGVYDNLGLEWFLKDARPSDYIVVSEASGTLRHVWKNYRLRNLLRRVQDVQYEQSRAVRQRWLHQQMRLGRKLDAWVAKDRLEPGVVQELQKQGFIKRGVILSIDKPAGGGRPGGAPLSDSDLPVTLVAKVAGIRTDVDSVSAEEVELLAYHGYRHAHVSLSDYGPALAVQQPGWRLDLSTEHLAAYERALADSGKRFSRGRRWW